MGKSRVRSVGNTDGMRMEWTAEVVRQVVNGEWLIPPPPGWRTRGFVAATKFSEGLYKPNSMVVVAKEPGQFGFDVGKIQDMKGVAGVLVDGSLDGLPPTLPVLRVSDRKAALLALAKRARDTYPGRVFGVTGSCGKSTTCDLLVSALRCFGSARQKIGQNTSLVSVARFLTVFLASDFLVIEMARKKIEDLAALARPHCGIVTSLAEGHLEKAGSLRNLAVQKAHIFDNSFPGSVAVLNREMPYWDVFAAVAEDKGARVVTFGSCAEADVRLTYYEPESRNVRAAVFGREATYSLNMTGRHMAMNSLAVLAALTTSGLNVDVATATLGMPHWRRGRGAFHELTVDGRSVMLIDDAYNANPLSMRAGLDVLGGTRPTANGRRIAVIGEMRELGPDSPRLHAQLADAIMRNRVDRVFAAGAMMEHLWKALPPEIHGVREDDPGTLAAEIRHALQDGDVVLVKGSHSTGMHEVVSIMQSWPA